MTQNGKVVSLNGDKATVSVVRTSSCKGCSAAGCMGCQKSIETPAENPLGAAVGDKVVIESPSGTILKFAAFVFLMPVAAALVFYYLGFFIFGSGAIPYVAAAVSFAGCFVFLAKYLDKKAAKETEFRITEIINDAGDDEDPAESTDKK